MFVVWLRFCAPFIWQAPGVTLLPRCLQCHCALQFVTLWSRRRGLGPYVQFTDSSESLDPNWHPEQIEIMDRQTNFKVGAHNFGSAECNGGFSHVVIVAGIVRLSRLRSWTGRSTTRCGAHSCSRCKTGTSQHADGAYAWLAGLACLVVLQPAAALRGLLATTSADGIKAELKDCTCIPRAAASGHAGR